MESDAFFVSHNMLCLGASRRLLGMTFEGETRDTDGILWFDAEVNGLTNDVCVLSRISLLKSPS